MKFEKTRTSYAIEIDQDKFLALLDSESYVTDSAAYREAGAQSLFAKLIKTPAEDVEYNGHFGCNVYLSLDVENDTDEVRAQIIGVINNHLDWCLTLDRKRA